MKKRNLTRSGLVFILSLFLLSGQMFAQSYTSTAPSISTIPVDGIYDGTIASMATMPIDVSGYTAAGIGELTVNLNVDHTWVGDLVIKLEAPDGTIIGLMSRPGFAETVDNGQEAGVGTNSDLLITVPVTFEDGAPDSAENMGNGIPNVGDDTVVSFAPAPGAIGGFPDLASFAAAVTTVNGQWLLHIGDSNNIDTGNINEVTLNISECINSGEAAVPTMSQWGLFLFALVTMSLGLVFMYKMENQQTLSTANGNISGSFQSNLPFEMDSFKAAMKHALGMAVVGFAIILVIWGTIIPMDLIGMTIAIPVVAYMIHVAKMLKK